MKKLTAVLALGLILYSCTENEKPNQLNLEEQIAQTSPTASNGKEVIQIPSQAPQGRFENAMMHTTFTPINDLSGDYATETTLLDISEIECGTNLTDVTDGILTLDFDKPMDKRQADVCGWIGNYGTFPNVEGPNPHILFSLDQNSIGITPSVPLSTFGFELLTDAFDIPVEVTAEFYSGGILIGSITRSTTAIYPPDPGQAKIFAAQTDQSFDFILIKEVSTTYGFSFGQVRYTVFEKNPFTVDLRPENCDNSVNVNSNGVIPVAILASMDLDVNDIDLSTVRLNGVAPQVSSIADLGGFYEKEEACDCDPTELDGIMDLNLKFNTQAIVATLGNVSDGQKVTVPLTFDTMDGKSWTGEDCILIIKKGKK